jgi:CBS domain-containing protein
MELSRNLRVDSISRLGPATPVLIDATASVSEALDVMRTQSASCLVVVDDSGRLAGVFTERDLITRVLAVRRPLETALRACMTVDPVTVEAKDTVRTAIKRMQSGGYRHLPVVDDEQRPVGLLSAKRIVNYLAEHFPATIFNHPPEADAIPATAEGA